MIEKNEVDIAVADLTITRERGSVVHFLHSLLEVEEELFMKNPEDALSLESYTKPFTCLSWIGILFTVLAVSPIFAMIALYSEGINAYKLHQCYNFVAQCLILRTSNDLPSKDATRIAAGTFLFAGIVVYQCWEASLESMLAIRRPDLPFQTLEGLLNSKYRLITAKGTVYVDQFKYSNDPFYAKVWNEKMKPYEEEFPLYEKLAEETYKNQYFVSYGDLLLKEHELYQTCKILSLGHVIRTSQLAWAIGKESPFKAAFHQNLNKLKEIGAIQKYTLHHGKSRQPCKAHGGEPITIKQCISAFFLLISGVCGGLFWFILELCIPYSWIRRLHCIGLKNDFQGRNLSTYNDVASRCIFHEKIYQTHKRNKRKRHRLLILNLKSTRKMKNLVSKNDL